MNKTRINPKSKNVLLFFVREKIDAALDKGQLVEATARLEAEAVACVKAAYPLEDMETLSRYDLTERYSRFTFACQGGSEEEIHFSEPLAYDLPSRRGGYIFPDTIPASELFGHLLASRNAARQALDAIAERQYRQAEILVNVALYFEDVLDFLGIAADDRPCLYARSGIRREAPATAGDDALAA